MRGILSSVAAAGLAALAFFLVTLLGNYDWVARIGGAAWVFTLAMIIGMPLLIPLLRDRGAPPPQHEGHH